MQDRQRILQFINEHPLMVISTLNSHNMPESAVVGFGETESFELIFGTDINTRKAQNILANGNVSVVIGWDGAGTIQYEGVARKLEGEEVNKYSAIYFEKVPKSRRHKDIAGETYFLIEPKWLRYTEVAIEPWRITEIQAFPTSVPSR
jgi:pyridoxine/pyridoxamine 5'-phosphate oxidase